MYILLSWNPKNASSWITIYAQVMKVNLISLLWNEIWFSNDDLES
jgi:hypothetical protein